MISHIKVKNFQIHKAKSIKLDPLITCLIGGSDKGKTAIIRSLKFLAFNQPSGIKFIRRGQKEARVSTKCDGKWICRIRGKRNLYRMGNETFEAFGAGKVPTVIQQQLNMTEDNFQFQLNPHFWIHDSPAKLAQNLNKIVALESIDKSIAKVISLIRAKTAKVDVLKEQLEELEEEFREIAWAIECGRELDALIDMQEQGKKKSHKIAFADSALWELSGLIKARDNAGNAIIDGKKLIVAGERYETIQRKVKVLGKAIKEYDSCPRIDPQLFLDFQALDKLRQEADAHAEETRWVELQLNKIREFRESIKQNEPSLAMFLKKLSKLKVCPTCQQPIKEQHSHSSARTFTSPRKRLSRGKKSPLG